MAGLRKASSYSKKPVVPYTRTSKKKQKAYIKTIPPRKIVKFSMGDEPGYEKGKFQHELTLVAIENVQIRQNSLEACRQFINKKLETQYFGQFYFKVVPVPHHIQRENKMLTGAGSDRMQTGMQLSFGKAIGKAAIMKEGKPIFFIALPNEKAVAFIRTVLKQIKSKLPCKTRILYEFKKKI